MINNPVGYYLVSGSPAIVIPYGDVDTAIKAADIYQADFLILDDDHVSGLDQLYDSPTDVSGLDYLGSINTIRYFKFTNDEDGW